MDVKLIWQTLGDDLFFNPRRQPHLTVVYIPHYHICQVKTRRTNAVYADDGSIFHRFHYIRKFHTLEQKDLHAPSKSNSHAGACFSLLFDLKFVLRTKRYQGCMVWWRLDILHSNTHIAKMSWTNLPAGLLGSLLSLSRRLGYFPDVTPIAVPLTQAEKMVASFVVHCSIPSATPSQVVQDQKAPSACVYPQPSNPAVAFKQAGTVNRPVKFLTWNLSLTYHHALGFSCCMLLQWLNN
jgi:hypothetical protein